MDSSKARKKIRSRQHIMESDSYQILSSFLPKAWVLRPFNNPDYGIDVVIELFEERDEDAYEVLGEYLYVQVKSQSTVDIKKQTIYSVDNVSKGELKEDKTRHTEIDVVKYVLDTDTILSIQESGAGVAIVLFVVDLTVKEVYFICLNDYIDKIILPANPNYIKQGDITVTIPVCNRLSNPGVALNALRFYGKRAKLLAAFSKIHYQKNEIGYIFNQKLYPLVTYRDQIETEKNPSEIEIRTIIRYFISQLEYLDVWKFELWMVLPEAKKDLDKLKADMLLAEDIIQFKDQIIILWHRLSNISTMYEEICREWYLPKMISLWTSCPNPPKIIEESS